MSSPNALNLKYDPRVKPPMWGPLSAVQSAVRHNCDRLGLGGDLVQGIWPCWEQGGSSAYTYKRPAPEYNSYFKDIPVNGNINWSKKGLDFGGDYATVYDSSGTDIDLEHYPQIFLFSITFYDLSSDQGIINLPSKTWADAGNNQIGMYDDVNVAYVGSIQSYITYKIAIKFNSAFSPDPIWKVFIQNETNSISGNLSNTVSELTSYSIGFDGGNGLNGNIDFFAHLVDWERYDQAFPLSIENAIWKWLNQPYRPLYPIARPVFFDMGAAGTFIWDLQDIDETQSDFQEGTLTDVEADAGDYLRLAGADVLSFDGTDDYVQLPNTLVSGLTAFTFLGWVKIKDFSSQSEVIDLRGEWESDCRTQTDGTLNFKLQCDGTSYIVTISMPSNTWVHCAFTWEENGDLTAYKNGNFIESLSTTGAADTRSQQNRLGYSGWGTIPLYGEESDITLWNVARTQTEIQDNMHKRLNGDESGLVAYYKLNEGTGDTATDSAGSNDGTINGASWSANEPLYFNNASDDNNRLSPQLDLSSLGTVDDTLIEWTETLNNQTITIETRVSLDGGSTWTAWATATNGGTIPDLSSGTDVSNGILECRQTLSTSDSTVTPELHSLNVALVERTFITVTDSAQGTDNIANISNQLKVSDSGQGTDSFGDILANLTVQDSGQGSDVVQGPSVNLTVSDTATATDTVSQILNSLVVQDSGQGTDVISQILANLIISDVGAGADALTVDTGAISKLVTDSATGTDSISVPNVSLTVSDEATAQDLIANILAQLSVSDSATATEAINVIKTKLVQIQDSAVGTDQVGNISVSLTVSDMAQATDAITQILNSLTVTDTAQAVENIIATNIDLLPKGRVRITFTAKAPNTDFSGKGPNIKFQ